MKKRHTIPTRTPLRDRLLGALGAVVGSPLTLLVVSLASSAVAVLWVQP